MSDWYNYSYEIQIIFATQVCIWYTQVIILAKWVPKTSLIFVYSLYIMGLYFVEPIMFVAFGIEMMKW